MEKIPEIKAIIDAIRPEFEEINPGFANLDELEKEWKASRNSSYDMHPQLAAFYLITNGICRLNDCYMEALSIVKLKNMETLELYMGIPTEDLDEEKYLGDGVKVEEWVVFGGEGLYGAYLINLRKSSSQFGNIMGFINNIPEEFGHWDDLLDFLQGIPRYCEFLPLTKYVDYASASNPNYGYSFSQQ
jgi:hypothetical protein